MSPELVLSPHGRLFVEPAENQEVTLDAALVLRLSEAFNAGNAQGLERLATHEWNGSLPMSLGFWRDFSRHYFTRLCQCPDLDDPGRIRVAVPTESEQSVWLEDAPPMKGLEYLDGAVLVRLWSELEDRVISEIRRTAGGAQAYLRSQNPLWNAVGRVSFHLAENKRNPEFPFAFLATYTHRLSEQGRLQHLPLGRALQEYAGARNRSALTTLLHPVQRAAEKSKLARELLDSRAMFHPQAWTPAQAYRFLKEIPAFEESGVTVRIPDWWKAGRPPRPRVSVRLGDDSRSLLGKDGLLDFKIEMTLDGEPLNDEEWKRILNATNGLALLRGKWVEVDQERLSEVLNHWKKVEAEAGRDGVSLLEGLRLLAGFAPGGAELEAEERRAEWSEVLAGGALAAALDQMQNPQSSSESEPGPELLAQLRPYQREGLHWLWFMSRLRLGACLADDMGLGKTLQVIALLLVLKRRPPTAGQPRTSLLIVPASLIANWKSELQKFAPSLSALCLHPAELPADTIAALANDPEKGLAGCDLLITSYGLCLRFPWLKARDWNLVILDEAQAIKNPSARQTRAAKEMRGRSRVALTGTPIENRLSDLWSLFDFICPGLLGGAKEFGTFVKSRSGVEHQPFAPLRRLVRPYILRRLKTDKRVIEDLPDKTELSAFCPLSRPQAVLYQQSVEHLSEKLESPDVEGMQRRGIILAFLTRFKQICNHPSQWLGDGGYRPEDSGKFQRLRQLCEEISARQEKVLVFSQYREIAGPLAGFLSGVFGHEGLILHGETPVRKRKELVDRFQTDGGPPFFVLSLKAGGVGLNLTAASHVIHFDRWWNPAVENQATDRAFRIGQRKNVMVHKFICRGTVEQRIHDLILNKTALAEGVLGHGAEQLLTEMNNAELLRFVSLDLKAVEDD